MRRFVFVLASTATLTMTTSAIAEYVAPPPTNPLQTRSCVSSTKNKDH